MTTAEFLKLELRGVWLLIAAFCVGLPVFLPSSTEPGVFTANVIGTATVTMFILSFPASLFGLPLLFFAQATLGFDPNRISGMYVNLILLFVLGFVQWFWIVPKLRRKGDDFQDLGLPQTSEEILLIEDRPFATCRDDVQGRMSPLERVIRESDHN